MQVIWPQMWTFLSSAVNNMNDNQIESIYKLHFHIPPLARNTLSCEKARQLIGPVDPLKRALSWYPYKYLGIRLINKFKWVITNIICWILHKKCHWGKGNMSCEELECHLMNKILASLILNQFIIDKVYCQMHGNLIVQG